MTRRRVLFWILFAVTLGVYGAIVGWSLPIISANAGGLVPFDMRPAGYSLAEAQAFLAALSPAGLVQYLGIQHALDTAYPALLALTLVVASLYLVRGGGRWALVLLALVGVAADYTENAAVRSLLAAGADTVSAQQVAFASGATIVKSGSTTLVFVTIALILIWRGWQRLRG